MSWLSVESFVRRNNDDTDFTLSTDATLESVAEYLRGQRLRILWPKSADPEDLGYVEGRIAKSGQTFVRDNGRRLECSPDALEVRDTRPDKAYHDFLLAKIDRAPDKGIEIEAGAVNSICYPHQVDSIVWGVRKGCAAYFHAFGLGKTILQIETCRLIISEAFGNALIVAPLGVRQEFRQDADMLGLKIIPIRSMDEIEEDGGGIYLTHYQAVRDGKIDPREFTVTSLDEASCLRGFGGSKTFRELIRKCEGSPYKFVATATPAPNSFIEIAAYAAFLGIMDVGEVKTRFFCRNSQKANDLTINPHMESEFYEWLATWALFVTRPSDLGYPDKGYELPKLTVRWHEVPTDDSEALPERSGQGRLYKDVAMGLQEAAAEKKSSRPARLAKLQELLAERPKDHLVIWHHTEVERKALEKTVPGIRTVYGSQRTKMTDAKTDLAESLIIEFANGEYKIVGAKPVMFGSGVNMQRHCHWAVFFGIDYKFNDFIQAIHRIWRFLQTEEVTIDIIYSVAEVAIKAALEKKWSQHTEMVERMSAMIRDNGLARRAIEGALVKSMGVTRREVVAEDGSYRLMLNDCVEETRRMETGSVGLVVTSIPFGSMYEYSPLLNDMGHTRDYLHFWEHMSYLAPELLRVLQPGRVLAIHVKDRIVPGGISGFGFQTVHAFSDECKAHFTKHGFAFLARITVCTDVVRENGQTNRLGWTRMTQDGTRMGNGLPEYVMIFRAPQTDRSQGWADVPVVNTKPRIQFEGGEAEFDKDKKAHIIPGTGSSRGRWQQEANGFWRSSGDRLLEYDDLETMAHERIYKGWRAEQLETVYDYDRHVALCEEMERWGRLPTKFMVLPPHSWHEDVWSDISRFRTLNMQQAQKGQSQHLCPMQLDIVDRLIDRFSAEGEVVYDPFGGLFTTVRQSILKDRIGWACELNAAYFADGRGHVESTSQGMRQPTLFDMLEAPGEEDDGEVS